MYMYFKRMLHFLLKFCVCHCSQQTGIKRTDGRKFPCNQVSTAQQAFTQNLYAFMKARLTPIGRLPLIGNKEST